MSPPDSFTFAIETLGCKANLTDSHVLADRLMALGGRVVADTPEVYILNSCTVTDRADRDAVALLKKKRARLRVLTGCLAEVDPALVEKIDTRRDGEVLLARNSGKQSLPSAIVAKLRGEGVAADAIAGRVMSGDRSRWHHEVDFASGAEIRAGSRTRAFLKVQDGCNQFCSYCIIPHARGRSRSIDADTIVREVSLIADSGVKEVVLTAIHAADYNDGGKNFRQLVERVLEETRVSRVRLTSLDPSEIDGELLDLMAKEPRICAHLHVSLQSASGKVLREMRRHYDVERAEACLREIHAKLPHAFVGMDMIAGFPGETDADHADTMLLLARTPWTRLHVFPYSERRLTAAARMVEAGLGVPEQVKRSRAKDLRALSDVRYQEALAARVGKVMEVLTEEKKISWSGQVYAQGHSRSYFKVMLPGNIPANRLARVQISGFHAEREALLGKIL